MHYTVDDNNVFWMYLSLVLWWRLNHLRDKKKPEEKITSMLFNPKSGIFYTADKIVLIIAIAILSYFAVQISDEWMYAMAVVCMIICATYAIKKNVLQSIIKNNTENYITESEYNIIFILSTAVYFIVGLGIPFKMFYFISSMENDFIYDALMGLLYPLYTYAMFFVFFTILSCIIFLTKEVWRIKEKEGKEKKQGRLHAIYTVSEGGIRKRGYWLRFVYAFPLLIWIGAKIIKELWRDMMKEICRLMNGLTKKKGLGNALIFSIIVSILLVYIYNSYFPIFRMEEESTKVFDGITTIIVLTPVLEWYLERRKKSKEA